MLVSYLHVVFGEMVPKNLSFSLPDRAVLLLAPPLVFLARLFRPIIIALNATANGVLRLFGVEPKSEANSTFTLEEVQTIVDQSRREGVLDDASGTLTAAFEFTTKRVKDVAVPMSVAREPAPARHPRRRRAGRGPTRLLAVPDPRRRRRTRRLRAPEGRDRPRRRRVRRPHPAKRVRRLVSIFDGTDLEDALATMRRLGTHVARTFDEDGVATGVIFLEDIIEELVGEVQDATRRG